VREYKSLEVIVPGTFDLVVANPPYRKIGSGRKPAIDTQLVALFEAHGDITAFAAAGAYALKHNGRFCCVYSAQRLPDLCAALSGQNLTPKLICPVHSRADAGALLVLMEARHHGRIGLKWSPSLYLT
jgi:tRNA1(Val) A37 N6-methylase TrmN6